MQNSKEKFKKEFKARLYTFVLRLIKLIDILPKDRVSHRLSDQLVRSGTSVLANYIEGLSASSKKDLTNFFNHSLKSANESKVWVTLLKDTNRIKDGDIAWFLQELDELSKIFAPSILTLKGKR